MRQRHRSRRMVRYVSTVGFSLLAGILAPLYLSEVAILAPASGVRAVWPPLLATHVWPNAALLLSMPVMISAAFCWWVCIIAPGRTSLWAGACTGLFSVILALPIMWMIVIVEMVSQGSVYGSAQLGPAVVLSVFEGAMFFWMLSLVYLCVLPFGWGIFLVAGGAGTLYMLLVRRGIALSPKSFVPEGNMETSDDSMREPGDGGEAGGGDSSGAAMDECSVQLERDTDTLV